MQQVPVAEGLFRSSDESVALIGSRCAGCGTHYFPRSLSCRNPACSDKRVADVEFGAEGRLWSYTRQSYRPPPLFRMDDWESYVLGLVELPEGIRVLAMITGVDPDDLAIDMPLALATRALYTDDSGVDVLTYTYVPAAQGATS